MKTWSAMNLSYSSKGYSRINHMGGRAAHKLFVYAWWVNLYFFFMGGCLFRKKYFVHGEYFPGINKIIWVFPLT